MEKQNSMKINQLPSKTWYWLGLNDTKVKWAAGAPCEICAEELSADDEITGFPEAMNTGAGKETDVLFAPEQTKNWTARPPKRSFCRTSRCSCAAISALAWRRAAT